MRFVLIESEFAFGEFVKAVEREGEEDDLEDDELYCEKPVAEPEKLIGMAPHANLLPG